MNRYCFWWSNTEHIAWPRADWTWSECEVVSDCVRWGYTSQWWKAANWWWSACSSSFVPPPGPTASFQPPLGVDAMTLQQPWLDEPWSQYRPNDSGSMAKRKKLIRLICKVRGQEFDEEKEVGSYHVSVDDIKLVVKKVANIDLDLRMEE